MEGGQPRKGLLPNTARPIASAATELSTTRPNERVSKSPRISSQSEEHAGDRSIERCRDPAGRPAGNQQPS